jgi:hypothetical protein
MESFTKDRYVRLRDVLATTTSKPPRLGKIPSASNALPMAYDVYSHCMHARDGKIPTLLQYGIVRHLPLLLRRVCGQANAAS